MDYIDIAHDPIDPRYYKIQEDPTYFKSKLTGRGPLKEKWEQTSQPIMCCYKLVSVNFNLWGLRTKMENLIHDMIRGIYLTTHKQCFCWIDEWYELSFDKLRELEITFYEEITKPSSSSTSNQSIQKTKRSFLKSKL